MPGCFSKLGYRDDFNDVIGNPEKGWHKKTCLDNKIKGRNVP
jgi:hypothetical protein